MHGRRLYWRWVAGFGVPGIGDVVYTYRVIVQRSFWLCYRYRRRLHFLLACDHQHGNGNGNHACGWGYSAALLLRWFFNTHVYVVYWLANERVCSQIQKIGQIVYKQESTAAYAFAVAAPMLETFSASPMTNTL